MVALQHPGIISKAKSERLSTSTCVSHTQQKLPQYPYINKTYLIILIVTQIQYLSNILQRYNTLV